MEQRWLPPCCGGPPTYAKTLARGRGHQLWASTSAGIGRLDTATERWTWYGREAWQGTVRALGVQPAARPWGTPWVIDDAGLHWLPGGEGDWRHLDHGKLRFSDGGGAGLLLDVLVSPDGAVWLRGTAALLRLDTDGQVLARVALPSVAASDTGGAWGRDGSLWLGWANAVGRLRVGGTELDLWKGGAAPCGGRVSGLVDTGGEAPVVRCQGLRPDERWTGEAWEAVPGGRRSNGATAWDRHGRLWVLGPGGLHRADEPTEPLPVPTGLPSVVTALWAAGDGTLRVGAGTEGILDPQDGAWRPGTTDVGRIHAYLPDPLQPGALWVAGERGVLREAADGSARVWGAEQGLTGGLTGLSFCPDGQLWASLRAGVAHFDPGADAWSVTAEADGLDLRRGEAVTCTPAGEVWLGRDRQPPAVRDPATGRWRELPLNPDAPPLQQTVEALLPARDGRLWVGTRQGLYEFRSDGSPPRRYGPEQGLPSHYVTTLAEDAHGGLWVGTSAGMARSLDGGEHWQEVRPTEPEDGGNLHQILPVEDGGAWLAGRRLTRVDADGRTLFAYGGMDRQRRCGAVAAGEGGDMWVGSWGLLRYRPGAATPEVLGRAEGLPSEDISSLAVEPGTVWVGTHAGLVWLDPRTQAVGAAGLPEVRVAVLTRRREGGVWVALKHGQLWQTARGGGATPIPLHDAFDGTYIAALLEDRGGALWLGTGAGLGRYDPREGSWQVWGEGSDWPARTGKLGTARVSGLYEDAAGALWVGTVEDGLWRRDPDTGRWQRFLEEVISAGYLEAQRRSNPPSRYFADAIGEMVEDAAGRLWVAARWTGVTRHDPADGSWTRVEAAGEHALDLAWDAAGALWVARGLHLRVLAPDGTSRDLPQDALPRPLLLEAAGPAWAVDGMAALWTGDTWVGQPRSAVPVVDAAWAEGRWALLLASGELMSGTGAEPARNEPVPVSWARHLALADGRLCVAGDGLACRGWDEPGWRWVALPTAADRSAGITALAAAPGGTLWAGTAGGELCRLDAEPTCRAGLPEGAVTGLALAPDGVLWGTTATGAAHVAAGGRVSVIPDLAGTRPCAVAVDPGRGGAWFAVPDGRVAFVPNPAAPSPAVRWWDPGPRPPHTPEGDAPSALLVTGDGTLLVRRGHQIYGLPVP
ncbi:MAG: two-component regulator propeller domain-containing protein [Pseudomonadota bacterium]